MQHVINKHIYRKRVMQKIEKSYALKIAAIKAERYKWCDKRKVGLFNMSAPGASYRIVCETGITIINRYHLGIPFVRKAFCLLGFLSCASPTIRLFWRGCPKAVSWKIKGGLLTYVAVIPHCWLSHYLRLRRCPWNFECVVMDAWYEATTSSGLGRRPNC